MSSDESSIGDRATAETVVVIDRFDQSNDLAHEIFNRLLRRTHQQTTET